MPKPSASSSLDLCEYQAIPVARDDVDFATVAPPVALDDFIADFLKKLCGAIFAIFADVLI